MIATPKEIHVDNQSTKTPQNPLPSAAALFPETSHPPAAGTSQMAFSAICPSGCAPPRQDMYRSHNAATAYPPRKQKSRTACPRWKRYSRNWYPSAAVYDDDGPYACPETR